MSMDVWKIGQEYKASELCRTPFVEDANVLGGNVGLLMICKEMVATYEQVIEDQNEYVLEIELGADELQNLEDSIEAKIKKLEAEIAELNKKKENGTITSEEEVLLASKFEELDSLKQSANNKVEGKSLSLQCLVEDANNMEQKTKATIATDYGETAIEQGEPLTQVKDKRKSFWRKLFGTWNKSKTREFGHKLVDTGTELLDKVDTSKNTSKKILTFNFTNTSK